MTSFVSFLRLFILLINLIASIHVYGYKTNALFVGLHTRNSHTSVSLQLLESTAKKVIGCRIRQQGGLTLYSEFERTEPVFKSKPPSSTNEEKTTEELAAAAAAEEEEEKLRKAELSKEMKRKLLRELQSQGADPNYSAGPILGNPILLISGVVAILVLVGGKGFFY